MTIPINADLEEHLSSLELRRIKILSIMCYIAYGLNLIQAVVNLILTEYVISSFHFGLFIATIVVHYLQHQKYYLYARILLWLNNYIFLFYFSYFLAPNLLNENYYFILCILPLILVDNKILHYCNLVLCILAYYALDIYMLIEGQSNEVFPHNNLSALLLFVLLFITVYYFKNINENFEKKVLGEKNQAITQQQLLDLERKKQVEINQFKTHFFINLSHEIKTPLTIMKGNISRWKSKQIKEGEMVKNTERNITQISQLVDDLIDLSKLESENITLELEELDINLFLQQLVMGFDSIMIEKSIKLILNIPKERIIIKADKLYLERALNNVVHNAYKFTEEGGEIQVGAAIQENHVQVWVLDTGIGIPIEMHEMIFERFKQVDKNQQAGSGIGLNFSKEVIHRHDGVMRVESEEGKGSTFYINLPVVQTPTRPLNNKKEVNIEVNDSHKKVMIIDDHDEIRSYLKSVFHEYHVLEYSNGKAALKEVIAEKPDCIIVDYMMPYMNGYEFIKSMRTRQVETPTIMLTARNDQEDKLKMLRLGVDDYMTKPFNEEELKIRVQNLIFNQVNRESYIKDHPDIIPIKNKEKDDFLNNVNENIQFNIAHIDYSVRNLSEAMHMSERTLHRKMKSITGLTPLQYINELKLQEARLLIEKGNYRTLKEIVISVGFNNQTHFANLYEKRFGKRPE